MKLHQYITTLILLLGCTWLLAAEQEEATEAQKFRGLQAEFNAFWQDREYEKGKGFKQFRRLERFTSLREQSDGSFDPYAIQQALDERNNLAARSERDDADWTPLGPFHPYQGSYVGGMGRVNCFAFHPTNDSIWYAGAAMGGLWKTIDNGYSWFPLTDHLLSLGISSVALHPEDPEVIYIATGDKDGFRRRISSYSIGVWRSTNGGESWGQLGLPFDLEEQQIVSKLVIHPLNPDRIYASTLDGIFLSLDGGTTWDTITTSGEWYDLEIDPEDELVFYAASAGVGVYKSEDGGETLFQLYNGLPQTNISRIDLALAPSDNQVVYALVASNNAPFYTGFRGLYRSEDGGASWDLQSSSPNILGWQNDGSDAGGQGWFALTCAVDPLDANTIYVGSVNVWKSTDAGVNWEIKGFWYDDGNIPYIHADHHILQFRDNTLYSGNDGGVYYWNESDQSWIDRSNMLVISQIYRLGSYQGSPDLQLLLNGNQDNGSKLFDQGLWQPVRGGDGFECGFDPVNPDIMYVTVYYGNMTVTYDGGETWYGGNGGSDEGAWLTPYVIDQNHPGRLYKGTRRVYRSDDYADNWSEISNVLTSDFIHALAVSPSDENVLYAADWNGNLFRTIEGPSHWETLEAPSEKITYLAVHPDDPSQVYATAGLFIPDEKVFCSYDYGETWVNLSTGIFNAPVNTIALHHEDPDILYIGTDIGVLVSPDAGETWEIFSAGLPNVIVTELEIHGNSNTLLAATFGRGSWQTVLPDYTPVKVDKPHPAPEPGITAVYPNPFNAETRIEIQLDRRQALDVRVYNLQGVEVEVLAKGRYAPGRHSLNFNGSRHASGIYFVRAITGSWTSEEKLFLIR